MGKVRVYELAKELGKESAEVIAALLELGEFVRSASTTLEPATVGRVQAALGGDWQPSAPGRRQGWQPPSHIRRRPTRAPEQFDLSWGRRWIDPAERAAWIDAGLGHHDAALAEECRDAFLRPSDFAERVQGRTVGSRIRGGESVAQVKALLDEARGGEG